MIPNKSYGFDVMQTLYTIHNSKHVHYSCLTVAESSNDGLKLPTGRNIIIDALVPCCYVLPFDSKSHGGLTRVFNW